MTWKATKLSSCSFTKKNDSRGFSLRRYGSNLVLTDATFKTPMYAIPLFFIVSTPMFFFLFFYVNKRNTYYNNAERNKVQRWDKKYKLLRLLLVTKNCTHEIGLNMALWHILFNIFPSNYKLTNK